MSTLTGDKAIGTAVEPVGLPARTYFTGGDAVSTGLTAEEMAQAAQRAQSEGYVHRVLAEGDHFVWTLLGGKPDVTISADLAIKHHDLFLRVIDHALTAALDGIQPHHVELAAIGDKAKAEVAIQEADKDIAAAAAKGT